MALRNFLTKWLKHQLTHFGCLLCLGAMLAALTLVIRWIMSLSDHNEPNLEERSAQIAERIGFTLFVTFFGLGVIHLILKAIRENRKSKRRIQDTGMHPPEQAPEADELPPPLPKRHVNERYPHGHQPIKGRERW